MIFIKIDMHIHTNYSDGVHSPEEIVDLAIEKGLDLIAITDHDSIGGVEEAKVYSEGKNIDVVAGIEISCNYAGEEVHVLGYFIDYKNKGLLDLTEKLRAYRYQRAKDIVARLEDLGLGIDFEDVLKKAEKGNLGRPAVARVMVDQGYVDNITSAFEDYLGYGCPAYVEKYKIEVKEAVELIHDLGGMAVIAHPGDLDRQNFEEVIQYDFQGVECIHPKHDRELEEYFKGVARRRGMIITAGSDFHGENLSGRDGLGDYSLEIDDLSYFGR